MLNGSTVYGRQPVSMAYMLTPLGGGKGRKEREERVNHHLVEAREGEG